MENKSGNSEIKIGWDAPIKIKSKEVFQSSKEYPADQFAGVYYNGVQYFDFKNVQFVNSIVIAKLIYILKPLLKQGVRIKLVNVNDTIRSKIKAMGLDNLFTF